MDREENSTDSSKKRPATWKTSLVPVASFQGRRLPEHGHLAGYAALIEQYRLSVVLPPILAAIGERHIKSSTGTRITAHQSHYDADKKRGHVSDQERCFMSLVTVTFVACSSFEVAASGTFLRDDNERSYPALRHRYGPRYGPG